MTVDRDEKLVFYITSGKTQRSRIATSILLSVLLIGIVAFSVMFERKLLRINDEGWKLQNSELEGHAVYSEKEKEFKKALFENYKIIHDLTKSSLERNFQLFHLFVLAMVLLLNIALWGVFPYERIIKKLRSQEGAGVQQGER